MIMQNHSIVSPNSASFRCNWVTKKVPVIPIHVEIYMLRIFFVLYVIMTYGELCILLAFFVSLASNKDNTC